MEQAFKSKNPQQCNADCIEVHTYYEVLKVMLENVAEMISDVSDPMKEGGSYFKFQNDLLFLCNSNIFKKNANAPQDGPEVQQDLKEKLQKVSESWIDLKKKLKDSRNPLNKLKQIAEEKLELYEPKLKAIIDKLQANHKASRIRDGIERMNWLKLAEKEDKKNAWEWFTSERIWMKGVMKGNVNVLDDTKKNSKLIPPDVYKEFDKLRCWVDFADNETGTGNAFSKDNDKNPQFDIMVYKMEGVVKLWRKMMDPPDEENSTKQFPFNNTSIASLSTILDEWQDDMKILPAVNLSKVAFLLYSEEELFTDSTFDGISKEELKQLVQEEASMLKERKKNMLQKREKDEKRQEMEKKRAHTEKERLRRAEKMKRAREEGYGGALVGALHKIRQFTAIDSESDTDDSGFSSDDETPLPKPQPPPTEPSPKSENKDGVTDNTNDDVMARLWRKMDILKEMVRSQNPQVPTGPRQEAKICTPFQTQCA